MQNVVTQCNLDWKKVPTHCYSNLLKKLPLDDYSEDKDRHRLTFSGQNIDADARVTQFDEGGVPSPPVLLSDQ